MHSPAGNVRGLCNSLAAPGCSWSVPGVMTAQSIGAGDAVEYARYLRVKDDRPGARGLLPEPGW